MTPSDLTVENGVERYRLDRWQEEQLAAYIQVARARIAASRKHGIMAEWVHGQGTRYVNAHGEEMIANSMMTEWTPSSDFCASCGANQDHIKAYGHYHYCVS